jgi:hypothetical protein
MKYLSILFAVGWAVGGCKPVDLEAISAPPPAKVATLNNAKKDLTLSKNVALAFECTNQNGPCSQVKISIDDPTTVQIRPAYTDRLVPNYSYAGTKKASVFVAVGKTPGETNVHFSTNQGSTDLWVTVKDDE